MTTQRTNRTAQRGFSLIELLIAMAIFTIVTAAAFQLYTSHMRVYSTQQDLAGLNMSLRNGLSMMQVDMNNAGTGVFVGANVPNWPIGVTMENSVAGGGCFNAATQTYTAACFDALHIVAAAPNSTALNPQNGLGGCVSTTTGTLFAPAGMDPAGLPLTLAQTAAQFRTGDQVLLVRGNGQLMTSVVLTADSAVAGALVQMQYTPTAADGTGNDPLFITNNANARLDDAFCPTDWLVKLRPVTYRVDATNPANPILTRTEGNVTDVLADQIIGFKVGATLWNGVSTSSEEYNYDASTFGCPDPLGGPCGFDYTLVRSVRVSIIGRTRPNNDPVFTFRNTFDNGPYQILAASVVVNPRNLSMRD